MAQHKLASAKVARAVPSNRPQSALQSEVASSKKTNAWLSGELLETKSQYQRLRDKDSRGPLSRRTPVRTDTPSCDDISTVDGEAALVRMLNRQDSCDDTSTVEAEQSVIHRLQCDTEGSSVVEDDLLECKDLLWDVYRKDDSRGMVPLPDSSPRRPSFHTLDVTQKASAATTITALLRSTNQRSGTMVLCFLNGVCVHKAEYATYLRKTREKIFRQLEALPVELRVPLPNPPSIPPPDIYTSPQQTTEYNKQSIKILNTWLPQDAKRGNRRFGIGCLLAMYNIPDPTVED